MAGRGQLGRIYCKIKSLEFVNHKEVLENFEEKQWSYQSSPLKKLHWHPMKDRLEKHGTRVREKESETIEQPFRRQGEGPMLRQNRDNEKINIENVYVLF